MTKPAYYRTPLKRREDIVAYLLNRSGHSDGRHSYRFAFNVKLHGLDLDFDHLLEVRRKADGDDSLHDAGYVEDCREVYNREYCGGRRTESLYQMALEDAQRNVIEWDGRARKYRTSDTFSALWDGTPVDAVLAFIGRCAGWIVLERFNGYALTGDISDVLADMPMDELRRLYQYVVMLEHDLRREAAVAEVEHQAAFNLFENLCANVERPGVHMGAGI